MEARLTKYFGTEEANRFNEDTWIFRRVNNDKRDETKNWRALSRRVFIS